MKIPLAIEINGIIEEEAGLLGETQKESGVMQRFKIWMRKRFFKQASRIVAVSDGIKIGIHDQYNMPLERIVVINNGANMELFKPLDKIMCKKELGLDSNKKYVCYVGNLAPWQGVEYFIEALHSVIKEFPETRFLIVGDGLMKKDLEDKALKLGVQDITIFTGSAKYEQVPYFINASDICVAPFSGIERNVKYGFSGIKLHECMACGKPFVTIDVCGIEDEIEPNGIGIVVKTDDHLMLAEAILTLLKDDKFSLEMGNKGREIAVKHHSWLAVARKVSKVCEGILS